MNIEDLADQAAKMQDDVGRSARVAGIDNKTGETFQIKGLEAEHHTDAEGSITVWVQLDKN